MSIPTLQEEHRRIAERPCGQRINVCCCAGCGAELPDTEAIVVDLLAADLRCDLCWRAMLAAEAGHHTPKFTEQEDPLAPWLRALVRVSQQA